MTFARPALGLGALLILSTFAAAPARAEGEPAIAYVVNQSSQPCYLVAAGLTSPVRIMAREPGTGLQLLHDSTGDINQVIPARDVVSLELPAGSGLHSFTFSLVSGGTVPVSAYRFTVNQHPLEAFRALAGPTGLEAVSATPNARLMPGGRVLLVQDAPPADSAE